MTDFPHVIVVSDVDYDREALYIGGDLKKQDQTIYLCDLIEYTKDLGPINLSYVRVEMPEQQTEFPEHFEYCLRWLA